MTEPTKQIASFISLILPEDVRKNQALKISVKERHLPSVQKQMIFEVTIMKDYKKAMTKKRLKWIVSGTAALLLFLSVGTCAFKAFLTPVPNGYESLMNVEMPSEVSVTTSFGTLVSTSQAAAITFTDTHVIMNGRDSVRFEDTPLNCVLVPVGKSASITLNDQTKITMCEESRLGIPYTFAKDKRMVFFCGDATFNVNHDEAHPFLVDADIVKTHVLGTEFCMNTHPEDDNFASVALYKGKVEVEFPGIETSVSLKPSEAVILKDQSFMKMNEIPTHMRQNIYNEVFELNGSIRSLVDKISEHYGITVQTSEDVEDIECYGRLILTEAPEELLDMLTYLIPIEYRYINDNTILMIKSN